jgi:hypothetical protein
LWKLDGAFIVNEKGKVFDIEGSRDREGSNILAWRKHGKINQQFDVVYADEWKGEPQKGELNEEFGLYVERPFYIISRMKEHRFLDLINTRQFAIKTRNGRNSQVWYFDQKSLTIKSKVNNQSWDIRNSGRTNDMQIWSTNSQWW